MLKEEKVRCMEMQDRPEIEEFIPLKANSGENGQLAMEKDGCDKKNWMSSAQLWSTETKLVIPKFSSKFHIQWTIKRKYCNFPVIKSIDQDLNN